MRKVNSRCRIFMQEVMESQEINLHDLLKIKRLRKLQGIKKAFPRSKLEIIRRNLQTNPQQSLRLMVSQRKISLHNLRAAPPYQRELQTLGRIQLVQLEML